MSHRFALTLAIGALLAASGCTGEAPTAEVGECLDTASLEGQVTDIPTLDCSQEHDGQVVYAFDMPGEDYPSDTEWASVIEERCLEGFEEFVGVAYADSALVVRDLSPTEESWDAGDRQVLCIAYSDGDPVSESFEDSKM